MKSIGFIRTTAIPAIAVSIAFAIPIAFANDVRDTTKGEWPFYAGNSYATKYSPLSQIDAKNVQSLQIAWEWETPDAALIASGATRERPGSFKATPIMIDGVLYTSTPLNQVAAVDASNGKTNWVFDPKAYGTGRRPANSGWQHRGVAFWEGKVGNKKEKKDFDRDRRRRIDCNRRRQWRDSEELRQRRSS